MFTGNVESIYIHASTFDSNCEFKDLPKLDSIIIEDCEGPDKIIVKNCPQLTLISCNNPKTKIEVEDAPRLMMVSQHVSN